MPVDVSNCLHDFVFLETTKNDWKQRRTGSNCYDYFYGYSKADRFYCKKCLKIEIREMKVISDDSRQPSWY